MAENSRAPKPIAQVIFGLIWGVIVGVVVAWLTQEWYWIFPGIGIGLLSGLMIRPSADRKR